MTEFVPHRPAAGSWWKRWLKRLAVTVGVCLLTGTGYTVGDRYLTRRAGEAELAGVLADLDATDPGWRLDDLLAAREARFPPPDRNPMELVRRVHKTVPPVFEKWEIDQPDWRDGEPNRRPSPLMSGGLACVRDECRAAIDEFRRLKDMPPGGYHLDVKPNPLNTLLEPTQQARTAAALLFLDATAAALAADPDRAVTSAHACLAAGRGIGDEPFLISMLARTAIGMVAVRSAERTLGLAEPRAGLAELQSAVLTEADTPTLEPALRGERAMLDRLFEGVDAGTIGLRELADERGPDDLSDRFVAWVYRGKLPADRAAYHAVVGAYLAATRRPESERLTTIAAVPLPPKDLNHVLSRLLLPDIERVAAADLRGKAALRAAAVGLACERYRQKHARWPNALADLGEFLPDPPPDPFTGRPLRLLRRPDGITVYSVGPDGTDDGGITLTTDGRRGTDVGFRLFDPDQRNRPPAEDEP